MPVSSNVRPRSRIVLWINMLSNSQFNRSLLVAGYTAKVAGTIARHRGDRAAWTKVRAAKTNDLSRLVVASPHGVVGSADFSTLPCARIHKNAHQQNSALRTHKLPSDERRCSQPKVTCPVQRQPSTATASKFFLLRRRKQPILVPRAACSAERATKFGGSWLLPLRLSGTQAHSKQRGLTIRSTGHFAA